jgi:hypothetical protein
MSPMKRVTVDCVPLPIRDPTPIARSKAANVTPAPTTAAIIAVTGKPSGVQTAASVTIAVIVPGPAANMMGRASEFGAAASSSVGVRLTDRLMTPEHVKSHIRDDHPANDSEHI